MKIISQIRNWNIIIQIILIGGIIVILYFVISIILKIPTKLGEVIKETEEAVVNTPSEIVKNVFQVSPKIQEAMARAAEEANFQIKGQDILQTMKESTHNPDLFLPAGLDASEKASVLGMQASGNVINIDYLYNQLPASSRSKTEVFNIYKDEVAKTYGYVGATTGHWVVLWSKWRPI